MLDDKLQQQRRITSTAASAADDGQIASSEVTEADDVRTGVRVKAAHLGSFFPTFVSSGINLVLLLSASASIAFLD